MGDQVDGQNALPFGYEAFSEWYERERQRVFQPALETLERLIDQLLDAELSDLERGRIRISSMRIKTASRAWTKITARVQAGAELDGLDSVPLVIDDIVGLRITCNNLSDVLRVQELIGRLPSIDDNDDTATLVSAPESEKTYHLSPRPSGYRAYHINLHTLVPAHPHWERVTGELQVRTLLQDGWGELTHEDTYKPGIALPPLATTIARRMADLLAAIDDLAQDLRTELERVATEAADVDATAGVPDPSDAGPTSVGEAPGPERSRTEWDGTALLPEVVLDETRRIIEGLSRPATLAEVAGRLRGAFGERITTGWVGFGTFKSLLKQAAPAAQIFADWPPGWVVPEGVVADQSIIDPPSDLVSIPDGYPPLLTELRKHDASLPVMSSADILRTTDEIADHLASKLGTAAAYTGPNPGIALTNAISKSVRDSMVASGRPVARGQIDYILKALLFSGNFRSLTSDQIREVLAAWLLARAQRLGLSEEFEDAQTAIRSWLGL